jgi:diguanylate cyclase (GGDEF)-like protein
MRADEDTVVQDVRAIAPEAGPEAYLIVLAGPAVGRMFQIPEGETVMGRAAAADLRLEDEGISRRHSLFSRRGGKDVWVQDLESTNGTYVNGKRVAEQRLRDGDKIQVGRTVILKFSFQDTLDEQFQRELYEGAVRDGLTRLYNQKFLRDRLQSEFAYALRHGSPLSLLLADIDYFKRVNDTYGHPVGDFVLEAMARRLSGVVRREDVLARYGGEEFAILCRETDRDSAIAFAERLRSIVAFAPFIAGNREIAITISVGLASLPSADYRDAEELLLAADRSLYRAKERGRNRVVYPGMPPGERTLSSV